MSERISNEEILQATSVFAVLRRRVAFQEVDAASTIFFAKIFEYFSDTYLVLLEASGLDVPGMLRERTMVAPLAHAEADFKKPLFFGDEVRAEIVVARAGKSSVSFGHRLRKADGSVAAIGQTVHVFVDPKSFQPAPVPAALAAYINKGPSAAAPLP